MDYAGVVSSLSVAGLFGIIIKQLNEKIKANKADIDKSVGNLKTDIDKRLDKKADLDVCRLKHDQISADFIRGQESFKEIIKRQEASTAQIAQLCQELALLRKDFNNYAAGRDRNEN